MHQIVIIGGGIIGLSSAYFLADAGFRVTVIDRSDMQEGCSYGNAGYLCPSHFAPLAAPGIVSQGLRWMLNSRSPFYIRPSFDANLLNWGMHFVRSATARHVERSAVPLRDISLLSKHWYEQWQLVPGFDFFYEQKGMLEFFKTPANAHHAESTIQQAHDLGLDAELLNAAQVQELEPLTPLDILGAIHFRCDAHLNPARMMEVLKKQLLAKGVVFKPGETVSGFETAKGRITLVKTDKSAYPCDEVVLAAGVWSRPVAQLLQLKLPMVGGRGYSFVVPSTANRSISHPIILSEARVAITPLGDGTIRFGGTMEITPVNTPPRMQRVEGIVNAIGRYFKDWPVTMPAEGAVWQGFRPCSADGLPYIGRPRRYDNLIVATGHAMLGLSLGAGTGKLVSELASGLPTSMSILPFDPDRFGG